MDNPMKGENDETAVKAGISPPKVVPWHWPMKITIT